ncbi:putative secreted protein [Wickerhamomyces ciferrii]|uniref:Secreted protein n=1 Tax=Wickerhamomyces ciferrii (strain ATCC 14091 / BCRC 22168 / CBS 111 / JCM 3599 / NBRC 0793 / NRRL Y-1031 F-60-10) TaxID=1206466 RepID=K0KH12_WICCF|nr:uncharacterized protein BN7_4059 [Wickerhamomyces ciferrii]CCH44495.1 putative secreted protein [Wickerhamomyces ciferrii]
MKLSTIIVQAILLTGIIASPIANPDDETSPLLEKRAKDKLCSDALQHKQCAENNYQNCVFYWTLPMSSDCFLNPGPPNPSCAQDRLARVHAHCRFYCSKIKNKKDCVKAAKESKILPAGDPNTFCDGFQYC